MSLARKLVKECLPKRYRTMLLKLKKVCTKKKKSVFIVERRERRDVRIHLRKRYIRLLKLLQMTLVFFIEKKDGKKHINYRNYWYKKVFIKIDLQ